MALLEGKMHKGISRKGERPMEAFKVIWMEIMRKLRGEYDAIGGSSKSILRNQKLSMEGGVDLREVYIGTIIHSLQWLFPPSASQY